MIERIEDYYISRHLIHRKWSFATSPKSDW